MTKCSVPVIAIYAVMREVNGMRMLIRKNEWRTHLDTLGRRVVEFFLTNQKCTDFTQFALDNDSAEWEVTITAVGAKRSLNANAYFHVLCREISKVTKSSEAEVKELMVVRYGTYARDQDGVICGAVVPSNTDIRKFYPYCAKYGETDINGKRLTQWLFLKQTHELDTHEMATLIDGVVSECKELGIETLTPKELEEMKKKWTKKDATSAADRPQTGTTVCMDP